MRVSLIILLALSLFSMGCMHWTGDRPVYYQRVIDNNRQFVPGHPRSYDDAIQKQVMIGNPFDVDIRLSVHCDDWGWSPGEIKTVVLKPQHEFSALVDDIRSDQWEQACHVKSWKRLK